MSERSKSKRSQCKYVTFNENLNMYILKITDEYGRNIILQEVFENKDDAEKRCDKYFIEEKGYPPWDRRLNSPNKDIFKVIQKEISTNSSETDNSVTNTKRKMREDDRKVKRRRVNKSPKTGINNKLTNNTDKPLFTHNKKVCKKNGIMKRVGLTSSQKYNLCFKQNMNCNICQNKLGDNHEADHIISLSNNGTNDQLNFQMLCISCHKWKSHYIDNNKEFIEKLEGQKVLLNTFNLNKFEFYENIINIIRNKHNKSSSWCYCKFHEDKKISKFLRFKNNCKGIWQLLKSNFRIMFR